MIRLGLDSIGMLCDKLDNPQSKLKFIHIAGTNGKGSVGVFIASILKTAGFRVGHFSSPAVFSREEVICINQRPVSKKKYDEAKILIDEKCVELKEEGKSIPTEFEKETAKAFYIFQKEECDVVVLECGMGGKTDATNIVENTLGAVFVPISMDHMDYLGDSLEKITRVKSGIIKSNSIVFSALQDSAVRSILIEEAKRCGCSFIEKGAYRKLAKNSSLKGINQIDNAELAITVVKGIFEDRISDKHIINGLKNAKLSGRFERIGINPVVIIDGGHNEAAALSLKNNIEHYYSGKKIIHIVGMLVNKDHDRYLQIMSSVDNIILTVSTTGDRGFGCEDLARIAVEYSDNVTSVGGVEEALDLAFMLANKGDVIVVSGTFTILADAKKWYGLRHKRRSL